MGFLFKKSRKVCSREIQSRCIIIKHVIGSIHRHILLRKSTNVNLHLLGIIFLAYGLCIDKESCIEWVLSPYFYRQVWMDHHIWVRVPTGRTNAILVHICTKTQTIALLISSQVLVICMLSHICALWSIKRIQVHDLLSGYCINWSHISAQGCLILGKYQIQDGWIISYFVCAYYLFQAANHDIELEALNSLRSRVSNKYIHFEFCDHAGSSIHNYFLLSVA